MQCAVTNCSNKVLAKGLCAKHYMRKRRNGDPTRRLKPGPKTYSAAKVKAILDRGGYVSPYYQAPFIYPYLSPRSIARVRRVLKVMKFLMEQGAADQQTLEKMEKQAQRPNRTINVSKFEEVVAMAAQEYLKAEQAKCRARRRRVARAIGKRKTSVT